MNNNRLKFRVWWQSPYTNVSSKFLFYDPHKNNYETDIIRDADCDFAEDIVYYDLRDIILGNIDEYTRPGTFTVEQCTELSDKNGNLIYEGDVVKIGNGSINGEVIESDLVVEWICKNSSYNLPTWTSDVPDWSHYVEIIGNIHEQAE